VSSVGAGATTVDTASVGDGAGASGVGAASVGDGASASEVGAASVGITAEVVTVPTGTDASEETGGDVVSVDDGTKTSEVGDRAEVDAGDGSPGGGPWIRTGVEPVEYKGLGQNRAPTVKDFGVPLM
jgi:hypothetical protein